MTQEAIKLALKGMKSFQNRTNGLYEGEFEEEIKALEKALKQEQGEPVGEMVAWPNDFDRVGVDWISYVPEVGTKLYTTPKQRTWVGLTDEESVEIQKISTCYEQAVELTEAKLKDKNI